MPAKTLTLPRHLGSAVREQRLRAGLTQARLADMAQVSRRLITSLELGDADGIAFEKVLRILESLDMVLSVDWPETRANHDAERQTTHESPEESPPEPTYQDAYRDIVSAALLQTAPHLEKR